MIKKASMLLIVCLVTCAAFAQNKMSAADKESFKTVVLSKDQTGMPVIKKWVVPVRYKIYQGKTGYHSTEIDSILSKIKQLTGLDIAATSNDDDVNLSIFWEIGRNLIRKSAMLLRNILIGMVVIITSSIIKMKFSRL